MRGGLSSFLVEIFMSHSAENFRKGILLFEKIFGFKKFYGWTGGDHVFPWKIFSLTMPKTFVGIPSMFQKNWGIEKFYA